MAEIKDKLVTVEELGILQTYVDKNINGLADIVINNQTAVDKIEFSIANKVDKVDGKGLSTNDLTDELKEAYNNAVKHANSDHAPINAQENLIESISIDGVPQSIVDKNIDLPKQSSTINSTATGKTITVSDSAEKPFENIRVFGRSEQPTTTGAQLLIELPPSRTVNGVTVTNDGDSMIFNGTATANFDIFFESNIFTNLPIGTYVLSKDIETSKLFVNNNHVLQNPFTITENNEFSYAIIRVVAGTTFSNQRIHFMLNAGSTPLPWEPYTGGKSSPSPEYPQEIVSVGDSGNIEMSMIGAQLYNVDDKIGTWSSSEDGWITVSHDNTNNDNYSYIGTNVNVQKLLKPATKYLIVVEIKENIKASIYPVSSSEDYIKGQFASKVIATHNGINVFELQTRDNFSECKTMLRSYVEFAPRTEGTCTFRISVIKDTTITPETFQYESYRIPQTLAISTPNGLPGIPVDSGGNYTDETGQQWICDEMDFWRGVYVKRIGHINTNPIIKESETTDTKWRLEDNIRDSALQDMKYEAENFIMSNNMQIVNQLEEKTKDYSVVSPYGHSHSLELRYWIPKEQYPTLENAIEAAKGEIWYPIATPIETPLTAEELDAYRTLHTNNPTTTVTNDADAYMEVTYAADTGAYIDKENAKLKDDFNQRITEIDESKVDKISGKGLSTNDYTTAEKNKLASLSNYDDSSLKARVNSIESDYASKQYVAEQVSNAGHLKKEIVTTIPEPNNAEENTIYMLKDSSVVGDDKYEEYMLVNGEIVKIGDTSIDLTNYETTSEVDAKLDEKVDKSVVLSIINKSPTVDTLDDFLELQRTNKVYQVKIPKFTSNPTSTCEKLGANAGLVFEPSTDTVEKKDDYADKIEFMWWHNNYVRNDDGYAIITALETDDNYSETGSVDVGSCGMSFYYKWDNSYDDYTMLSWSPSPHPELGLIPFSANVPGHSYWCLSAYPSIVASDGLLRSQPNGKIARKQSHNNMITNYQKKGAGYWGAGAERNALQIIFNLLMGATKNSQALYEGVTNWNFQYDAAVERDTNDTYFPVTASQAANLEVGCYVSVGYGSNNNGTINKDRGSDSMHSYADDVKILRIEDMEDGNKAVYLDLENGFNTTPVAITDTLSSPIIMSSMHVWTGETNKVIGKHNGSAVSNINGRHSYRVQGVEYALGSYIVASDTVMDFQSDYSKNVYIAPKGVAHSSSDTIIRNTYTFVGNIPASSNGDGTDYWIGDVDVDETTGIWYPSTEGSGSSQGMGDRLLAGGKTPSGTREYLQGGGLGNGSLAGSSFLLCGGGLGNDRWNCCGCD